MALFSRVTVASSVLLLVSTACTAAGPTQDPPTPAPTAEATAADAPATPTPTPTTGEATTEPLVSPTAAIPPPQSVASDLVPINPPVTATTPAPLGQPAGTTLPGVVTPSDPAPTDPATYVPKTEHDNTPWRFNMQEGGQSMSADKFDDWMKQRGVRVATGKPAIPLVQNCPTPEGDKADSDGDGIINCLDLCPASEAGQTIGPDGCPVPVSIDLKGVTFAYDKADLGAEAKAVLAEALEILQRYPDLKVEVAGHTDSRGDAKYNQALSERRAKAVYDYLVENGIDKTRLIGPVGFGEMRPLVPNQKPDGSDDPEGRAKNRRTELNIQN